LIEFFESLLFRDALRISNQKARPPQKVLAVFANGSEKSTVRSPHNLANELGVNSASFKALSSARSKMPKVVSYTPAWLSKPNLGHEIFTATHTPSSNGLNTTSRRKAKPGPRRTIAYRGTEVFIAVGKEIRWADLVYLKEAGEYKAQKEKGVLKGKARDSTESQYDEDRAQGYRVCSSNTPVIIGNINYSSLSKLLLQRIYDN
jgi:hypothetical protein